MSDDIMGSKACPRCGRTLPLDAPEGLCGACVLAAAAETLTSIPSSDDVPTISDDAGIGGPDKQRLSPGELWGNYRIGRLLGKGGMGEVYEAEQTDTGRRIALKVLRSRLQSQEDRARFLREGQLAASVSHPHTVYIFGSEEVFGMPVITMELLPGGTLKDRVVEGGPLSPVEAVSAILDIIGGLDAAQASGILHRDIKPSNCFLDNQGSVKVGDFGLSISTLARDVRHELETGGFQGTPQFAAPEQLRGEPLDVRADIYAVGATLYYLLTGRPPFEARDLHELAERVTNQAPKSPRQIRREIPSGLSAIVLQCLDKASAARPASYAVLADALRPYSSRQDIPAGLGLRLVAGAIDSFLLSIPAAVWVFMRTNVLDSAPGAAANQAAWTFLANVVYFVLLEGIWGASAGKRLLGIRVLSLNGAPPSFAHVILRTVVFYIPNLLIALFASTGILGGDTLSNMVRTLLPLTLLASLFSFARPSNGWAGLHELASGTRVVLRRVKQSRRLGSDELAPGAEALVIRPTGRRYGPFTAMSDPQPTEEGRLLNAFDPILRRQVWIHVVPPGTPPTNKVRCDVGRGGRLFWLTGRRSPEENWDAFEAPAGQPLLSSRWASQGWPTRKLWLMELANELIASSRDATLPPLALNRLWVRNDQRLVLLDFPAPGTSHGVEKGLSPVGLLTALASNEGGYAETGSAMPPPPLSATTLLKRMSGAEPPDLEAAQAAIADLASTPNRVQRWRRAVPIAFTSAPTVFILIATLLFLPPLFEFLQKNSEMLGLLEALHSPKQGPPGSRLSDPTVRENVEAYLVGRYGSVLSDDNFWRSAVMQGLIDRRTLAEEILARHPSVSERELTEATKFIAPELERMRAGRNPGAGFVEISTIVAGALLATSLILAVVINLISSLIVPGGILCRILGFAVVMPNGSQITRWKSLGRATLAWSPALLWIGVLIASPKVSGWVPAGKNLGWSAAAVVAVLIAGAAWTIIRPARGLHDWLTGTWVVPR